ncbi:autotransporter outer membrane beta-barrel domain-containing protein [Pantoea dispersa]|uniref:autotransporter outer membrane beta-barrel domain-containing protein n=2 Tax=Pantoea dispersa TaxID=59814 RepID=UPI00092FBCFA|nr:autotransporter outer membrane beta-barrel domain-containing protein [Pantoea dispersa]
MNKNYRVIWNYAQQGYVVASELARGKAKSCCSGSALNNRWSIGGAFFSALLLAISPEALADHGAIVTDPDDKLVLSNQTLQANGDNYHGLLVKNGGKASATDVTVLADGDEGYGIFSTIASSAIEMIRGSVKTSGERGFGVVSSLTGTLNITGTQVETEGIEAHGAYASPGGIINSINADYVTRGDYAYGVFSRATDSRIDLQGGSVTTTGNQSYGLVAGSGARLNANGVDVTTQGDAAYGVYSRITDSQINLQDGSVTTNGNQSYGLIAGSGGRLNANDVHVTTSGDKSYGVFAINPNSELTLTGGTVTTIGNGAYGVYSTGNNLGLYLNNTSINTQGMTAHGLVTDDGGLLKATDVKISTTGDQSYAVYANSRLDLNNASIETSGIRSYGLVGDNGGILNASGVQVVTTGVQSYGVYAINTGTKVIMADGAVKTSGNGAYGAYTTGDNAQLGLNNVGINTSGDGAYGIYSSGNNALSDLKNVSTRTDGNRAHGLVAGSGGRLNASGMDVVTNGIQSYGVYSNNDTTEITLAGGTVSTTGERAFGMYAADTSTLNARNVQISTRGDKAHGVITESGAKLDVSDAEISTSGNDAHGGYVTGEGSLLNVNNSTFLVSGADANGLTAEAKSRLNAGNNVIKITGSGIGVAAYGDETVLNLSDSRIEMGERAGYAVLGTYGSVINLKNIEIDTQANSSALTLEYASTLNAENIALKARSGGYGIEVQDGGTFNGSKVFIEKAGADTAGFNAAINVLNLNAPDLINSLSLGDSNIQVSGENGIGILSRQQATLADIKLANTAITANDGTVVNVLTGTNMNIDADNSLLSGGTLLKTGYGTTEGSTAGSVVLNGSNRSLFAGNVDIDRSQTHDSQINLSGNSVWAGASSGLQTLTLNDNSQWNLMDNSSVDRLTVNNSEINIAHNPAKFTVLTVNGNYNADNATLKMNVALEGDASETDRLHIVGDVNGNTDVAINNVGGSGAQTIQGLKLIQVDGAVNGDFRKKHRIVAGAFDYDLVRGSGANSHNWYLWSDINTSEPVPGENIGDDPDENIVEPPVNQHNMIVRPEAASYSANLAAANTLFTTSMDDRPAETFYTDASGQQQSTRLWLHNSAGHSRVKDSSGQLKSHTSRYAIQLGGDVASGTLSGSDSLRLGAMAGYGNAQSKSRSAVSGYQSRGQVNGYSLGVYGSWQQNAAEQSGAFVDSALSYGWFNNSVKGDDIGQQSYKSKGISASLAGGYRAEVATLSDSTSLWLRPQAQLNWQGVKADDVKEQNGSRVQATGQDNLQSRLGVRASLRTLLDPQAQSAIEPYAEANWLHNSRAFGTALNGVNIQQAGTRNAAEVKLGVDARLNANVNLWGGVAQQLGNHSYSDTSAVAGVKVSF